MRKTCVLAAVAVVAAGLVAADPGNGQSPQEGSPRDSGKMALGEIEQLLGRRAAALNNKDRSGFLATVDEKQAVFFEAQKQYYDRSARLPLGLYKIALDYRDGPELTRKSDREKYPAPVVVASVDHSYVLQGYDQHAVLRDVTYTFVKRADGWRIASDTDMEDLGEFTDRELWEFGPVQTRQSENFMLIFHPDQADFAQEVLLSAENSLPEVDKVWKRPWPRKVPILVPSNRAELVRLIEATFDLSSFVAFAVSSLDRKGDNAWELGGHRIVLNRENFLRHPEVSRRQILAHELVHIASRESSGPFTTAFVDEGFAQLTGSHLTSELNSRIKSGRFDRRLPRSWEFNTGGRRGIFNAYEESFSAFKYMQERYGVEAVNRFYEVLGKARIEPGTQEHHLDRALREALQVSLSDFESAWADFAVRQAG